MKKSRLLVLAAASAALCAAAVGCGGKHEHEYSEWDLTQAPTLTQEGSATRTCIANDGETVTVTVPALSDTDVWEVTFKSDATHTAAGKTVYTSEYGTVEITIAQGKHDWDDWEVTKKPNTIAEKGEMKRKCKSNDGEETATIDLTDTSVWKKDEKKSKPANHTEAGEDVYVSEKYGLEVSITVPKTTDHDWRDWEVSKKPTTIAEKGEVKRTCKADDGGEETEDIDLTDTEVWTKDAEKSTPNSHTADGEDVYVSEKYGLEVSITVPKSTDHDWDKWTIIEEPELDKPGTAKHSCKIKDCTEQDVEEPVPELNNADVWTKTETPADYNNAGKTVYTSEYGEVEIAGAAKKVAPYDGKTYVPIEVYIADNGSVNAYNGYTGAQMKLDEKGEGKGDAFPYRNETWKVSMVDAEKGKISIVSQPAEGEAKTYTAYVDMTTGVIVRPRDASWSAVYVFLPYGWEEGKSKVEAAGLNGSFAITYSKETTTESYFVSDDKVVFGVTIASDKAGKNKVDVADVKEKTPALVYVVKSELIASYAKDAEGEYVPADGYEGTYTLTKKGETGTTYTVVVSGSGIVTIITEGNPQGTYTLAEEGAGYTAGAYFHMGEGTQYFEVVLNSDLTGTIDMPEVTVTYNLKGTGTLTENSEKFNKNVVAELAEPADTDSKKFSGWCFDEACTQPVPKDYKPTADVTLYAKWSDKGSFTVVVEEGGAGVTVYFGDEDKLSDVLAAHGYNFTVEEDNWRVFRGWYLDAAYTPSKAVSTDTVLDATESGMTIYAKWDALPVYYGTFTGNALNKSAGYFYNGTVKIDEDGKVTLERDGYSNNTSNNTTGAVISYNETTQLITWKMTGDDRNCYMRFDKVSGMLAIAENFIDEDLDARFYILSRNGESFEQNSIVTFNYPTRIEDYLINYTKDSETKILFVYDNKIYADVSLFDYTGDALAIDEAADSKTLVVKKGGTVVLALGSTGTKIGSTSGKDELNNNVELKLLDAYYGKYTVGETDYFLNGLGQIAWEGVGGTASAGYTFVEDKNGFRIFDVFEREVVTEEQVSSYVNVGYYQLKVATASGTSTFEQIMVTVTLKNATGVPTEGGASTDGEVRINAKVPTTLTAPQDTDTHVFRGWFDNEDCNGDAITEVTYEVGATPTIYAKWVTKVVITFNLNYGDEPETNDVSLAQGETYKVTAPKRAGYSFQGWFDAENNEWTPGETAVSATITVYAHWEKVALPYEGTFAGEELYRQGNKTGSSALVVDSDGEFAEGSSSAYLGGKITNYDADKQLIEWKKDNTTYYFWFEPTTGVLISRFSLSPDSKEMGGDIYLMLKGEGSTIVDHIGISYKLNSSGQFSTGTGFGDFQTRFVTVNVNGTAKTILIFNNKIYTSFVAKSALGETLATLTDIKNSKTLVVYSDDECTDMLFATACKNAKFADGGECMLLDEYFGVYTGAGSDNVVLDGAGSIIYGDKTGTYVAVTGKNYTFDVDFGEERWWLTVDKTAGTFSIEKPMATIEFVMNGHGTAIDSVPQNVSKAYTLDTPTVGAIVNGYAFIGWYDNEDLEGDAITSFTPTEKDKTYTLYAKWQTPHALHGNWKGANVYGASNVYTKNYTVNESGKESTTLDGTFAVIDASVTKGNTQLGSKRAYYDLTKGFFVVGSSGSTFGTDVYYAFKAEAVAITPSDVISWNSNKSRLMKFTVDGETVYVFLDGEEDKVYPYVSVSVVDENGAFVTDFANFKTAGNVFTFKTYNNEDVASFGYINSTFVRSDGTKGNYSGIFGEIVSDGYGIFTLDGTAFTPTVAGKKLTFVVNNSMKVVELGTNAYTQVQDGYADTYTLPENKGTITLDGLGGAGGVKTYVVDGNNITIYNNDTDNTSTTYGIDVDNKVFLGKSVFAGLTFTKSSTHYIEFNDSTEIAGKMVVGNDGWYIDFTGELVGNTLTLTVTYAVGCGASKDDEVVLTLSGDTLTIVTEPFGNFIDATTGYAYTCADFSL